MERRHHKETYFTIVFICAAIFVDCVQCSNLNVIDDYDHNISMDSEMKNDYDDDEFSHNNNENDISVKSCVDNYPYTYSKCLTLCDPNLEATCLDDQLCLCDTERIVQDMNALELSKEFSNAVFTSGTSKHASCLPSDFCEDLCENDEKLKFLLKDHSDNNHGLYILGALCKSLEDEIESCVCNISSRKV